MRLTIILAALCGGCTVLSDHRVAAGCQIADGVTTYVALKKGAVELNPLFANASPGAILAIKFVFAYVVYMVFNPDEKKRDLNDDEKFAAGAVTLLGCVPAASNINVIRRLP